MSEEIMPTDAELAAELATEPEQGIVVSEAKTPGSALKQALGPLAKQVLDTTALAAKSLTEVLPMELYTGKSALIIAPEEQETLQKYAVAGDDDLDIRPDGLVYATHMFYRRALTEAFGPGGWADIPVSPIQVERTGESIHIYQRWALYVHGAYISEAIGAGTYWANNEKMDKTDAAEIARSQALTRNASKSSLGIATNPWMRREANEWRKRGCKQVIVETGKGRQFWWRRIDADPFTDREGRIIEKGDYNPNPGVQAPPVARPMPESPSEVPPEATAPKHTRAAKSEEPKAEPAPPASAQVAPPPPPVATAPQPGNGVPMVSEPQIRLFFAESRRRGLIKGEDARSGFSFLAEQTGFEDVSKLVGKTGTESCVYLLRRTTLNDFTGKILPALRAK